LEVHLLIEIITIRSGDMATNGFDQTSIDRAKSN